MLASILLFIIGFVAILCDADFYTILGVDKKASPKDIKKAYHKLSLQYHPDRNPEPDAKEKFAEITRAYEVLIDEDKRDAYDREGIAGVERLEQGADANSGNPFSDILSNIFGGGNTAANGRPKGSPYTVQMSFTLEELFSGVIKDLEVTKNMKCSHCDGEGAEPGSHTHKCTKCNGRGQIQQQIQFGPGMYQTISSKCPVCGGVGRTFDEKCHVCHGKGSSTGKDTLHLEVPAGSQNGQKIVFEGMGEYIDKDTEPGDIILIVKEAEHKRFKRNGNDLAITMEITLDEALNGFEKPLEHLDGKKIMVKRSKPSQPDDVMVLKNQGMPVLNREGRRGDLKVTLKVRLPQLSEEQRNNITKILREG